MKISKVWNTRTAVSKFKKNDEKIKGILYQYPSKKSAWDIENRIEKLNKNAKKLYKVFNTVKKPQNIDESERERYDRYQEFSEKLNKVFGKWINNNLEIPENNAEEDNRFLSEKINWEQLFEALKGDSGTKEILSPENENFINEIVAFYLRKKLRKGKQGITGILSSICQDRELNDEEKNHAEFFVEVLREDYNKELYKERIIKSIENQNMAVQPSDSQSGIFRLTENKHGKERKQKEKEGLSNFLSAYAELSDKTRMDYLRKLRRLLVLYFNTPKETPDNDGIPKAVENIGTDCNVWAEHEKEKKNKATFIDFSVDVESEKSKEKKNQLKTAVRKRNIECYRYSMEKVNICGDGKLFFEEKSINEFWIHHIENAVERILKSVDTDELYKIELGYLQEKVWKDILNYISIKYIAIGKAVFNFAMEDLYVEDKDICIGKISEKALYGLTSFDYEQIKAEETLQREVSVHVAFAVNNLARATVCIPEIQGKEDLLLWNKDDIGLYRKYHNSEKTVAAVLQFFGGKSTWDIKVFEKAYPKNDKFDYGINFLYDLKSIIYALRNETFHFKTANIDKGSWNTGLIARMFKYETAKCVALERDKFYSNNLHMFYKSEDLEKTLDRLYESCVVRHSQVPSFNSVFVRKDFGEVILNVMMDEKLDFRDTEKENGIDIKLKWLNALYYLFKEIYYNDFLLSECAKELFFKALDNLESKENSRAVDSFVKGCSNFKCNKEYGLSQICQMIMTEYNMQNTGNKQVKTFNGAKRNPDKFSNYKMILLRILREAFILYLKYERNEYAYIFKPKKENCTGCPKEEFLPEWTSKMYDGLQKEIEDDALFQKWYITGRFLNGRSLNLLIGSIRSYVQFAEDINRRANQTKNVPYQDLTKKIEYYKQAYKVLGVCIKVCSKFSNKIEDYFIEEDAEMSKESYAHYLLNYLDYKNNGENSAKDYLAAFCKGFESEEGIYYDDRNPILNRNIVMSKLFGPEQILEKVCKKVTEKDLEEYYSKKQDIAGYLANGKCKSAEEQKAVLDFQKLKNRIEFRDVAEYGEMINELLGQLINWSFLRERDLLYFQLGFHYCCFNNQSDKPEVYKIINCKNGVKITGAILYQIAAMYINGVSIYDKKFVKKGSTMGTRSKIGVFCGYSENILKAMEAAKIDNAQIYYAGLEVFENTKEHDNITILRNSIDHFKYYSGRAGSILDLYSEVFDRFFTYDMKYQKNVVNLLLNILKRHFVVAGVEFGTCEKNVGKDKISKNASHIDIKKSGLHSDRHLYKYEGGQLETDAKSQEFLAAVARILYYPCEKDDLLKGAADDEVKENEKSDVPEENRDCKDKSGKHPKKNHKDKKKKYKGPSCATNLGDLLKSNGIQIKDY